MNWLFVTSVSYELICLRSYEREGYLLIWQNQALNLQARVPKFSWLPALFSGKFYGHIEDDHVAHKLPFIKKSL